MYILAVYMMSKDGETLHSSIECTIENYPPTLEEVRKLEDEIAKHEDADIVLITNWLPLRKKFTVKL